MADVTITLTDEHVGAVMWAAAKSNPDKPPTVEDYISIVMAKAAESYLRQEEAEKVETLGREALAEEKAAARR